MLLTAAKRVLKTGFVDFWRNGFLSFAAVTVITLSLIALGGLVYAGAFGRSIVNQVKNQVDITVYFSLSASQPDILALKNEIDSMPEVASTTYETPDQALAGFQAKWSDNALIMQGLQELGGNPFPASITIKAKDPGQYAGIADFLANKAPADSSGAPLIERVSYAENKLIIDRLGRLIPAVEEGGAVLAVLLMLSAVTVVWNTVRLIAYSKRDEIAVMKLVGASNSFVRWPMAVSGAMYGLVSGILALLVMAAAAYWGDTVILRLAGVDVAANFAFAVNVFSAYFNDHLNELAAVILGVGIALGGLSSYAAARRYLKI